MRSLLSLLITFLVACGSNSEAPPTPGDTCKPNPTSEGGCYDSNNVVTCDHQSDGEYRWSSFHPCNISLFTQDKHVTKASCACSRPAGGAYAGYPTISGECNCWGE
jgi:hypothetical protein